MRPRANDFMPGQDSAGYAPRVQHSQTGNHGSEDQQLGMGGGQDHTFSTGHDASHQHQQLVGSSSQGGAGNDDQEELRGMTAGIGKGRAGRGK